MTDETESVQSCKYARIVDRFLAFVIDSTLLSIPIILTGVGLIFFFIMTQLPYPKPFPTAMGLIVGWATIIIYSAYFILNHSGKHQATIGKRLCRIYVGYANDGSKITKLTSSKRFIFTGALVFLGGIEAKLPSLPWTEQIMRVPIYCIWVLLICCHGMALFTKEKEALHDMLFNTRVYSGVPGEQDTQKRNKWFYVKAIFSLILIWLAFISLFRKWW